MSILTEILRNYIAQFPKSKVAPKKKTEKTAAVSYLLVPVEGDAAVVGLVHPEQAEEAPLDMVVVEAEAALENLRNHHD